MDTTNDDYIRKYDNKKTALAAATGLFFIFTAFAIGINDSIPALATMFAGAFLFLFSLLVRFGRTPMVKMPYRLLYWAPRTLSIVFAVFASIFALDIFDEGLGFWRTTMALITHLIPSFIIILVLIISWRREWISGTLYTLLALAYIIRGWELFYYFVYLIFPGLLLLTGILFLLGWRFRKAMHAVGMTGHSSTCGSDEKSERSPRE